MEEKEKKMTKINWVLTLSEEMHHDLVETINENYRMDLVVSLDF